jgi:hypothetical protein
MATLTLAQLASAALLANDLLNVNAAIAALQSGTATLEQIAITTPASPSPVTLVLHAMVPGTITPAFIGALKQRQANLIAALEALGAPTS